MFWPQEALKPIKVNRLPALLISTVCLLRYWLRRGNLVDHARVVDPNNGIIIDFEESSAIELSTENLMRCGGENATILTVKEVRQIKSA